MSQRLVPLCLGLLLAGSHPVHAAASRDWRVYLGDAASSHYSTLKQIDTKNVQQLEVAWTYHCGDGRAEGRSQIQCNPLIIDGVLFGTTPQLKLIALDAATGTNFWSFDPFAPASGRSATGVNRGLVYWADGKDRRILFAAGSFLHAIDARTGKLVPTFGRAGEIDLHDGLGRDVSKLQILSTTPGVLYRDLLILGTRVGEGPAPSAPGHLRAFDVRTGKLRWVFHTIPQPGEVGYETWPPDAWQHAGGANCWTGMAVDEKRGLVFIPTGSAAFDFWGGNRIGANLFANCLLALKADTGERVWHYQFVHHDLWDRDLPAPPNLVTVKHGGKKIDAVAQVTKSGHVFVFNRENGQPLFPIEEQPVPPSDLQGEVASLTQPVPLKPVPFSRQQFTEAEATDLSPEAHAAVLARLKAVRPHRPFTPPSREGTVIFPGFDGGAEWGGAAVDPGRGVLYVNGNEMPWILTMVETKAKAGEAPLSSGQQIYNQICAACHGLERKGDPLRNLPTLVGVEQKFKPADVLQLLEVGKGTMPSFAFLSPAQKRAVVDYLFGTASDARTTTETAGGDALGSVPYSHTGYNRFLDASGYPAVKPPWGTLNAIDLNTGEYAWKTPLGEVPELTKRGVPLTGTENYGGPIVTAGGLIFIAASKDEKFRAFDQRTGKVLWETTLPAGGYATPSTYFVKGRQYVVVACGGGKMGTKSGDAYVAFVLPRR